MFFWFVKKKENVIFDNNIRYKFSLFFSTEAASPSQIDVFLREACLLKGHLHANVNPLIATCLQNEKQPLLIFPYLNEGNLKKFLLRCKISERGTQQVRWPIYLDLIDLF